MVLVRSVGGAARGGAPTRALRCERGSQSLELALSLPAILLVVSLVIHAGLLGVDLVTTHGLAREAARAAAVDADPHDVVARSHRDATVHLRAAGHEHVEAVVTVHTRAFRVFGVAHEVQARATMRRER